MPAPAFVVQVLLKAPKPPQLVEDVPVDLATRAPIQSSRKHELPHALAAVMGFLPNDFFLILKTPNRWQAAGSTPLFTRTHK